MTLENFLKGKNTVEIGFNREVEEYTVSDDGSEILSFESENYLLAMEKSTQAVHVEKDFAVFEDSSGDSFNFYSS